MFEHLDDPTPPAFSDRHRAGVAARVRRHRRQRRAALVSASVVPVLLIAGVLAASNSSSDEGQRVDVVDTPSTTTTTAGPGPTPTTTTTPARIGGGAAPAKGSTPTTTRGRPLTAAPVPQPRPVPTTTITTAPAAMQHRFCSQPGGGEWRATSRQEFEAKVIGTWLACTTPTSWDSDESGVDIGADGRWAKVRRRASGEYVRLTGTDNTGIWGASDRGNVADPNHWEIYFYPDKGMTCVTSQPTFAAAVPRMRINYHERDVDYVEPPAGEVRIVG